MAIPQAYKEAFEIILRPHKEEEIIFEEFRVNVHPDWLFGIYFSLPLPRKLSSPNTKKMRVMKFM
jgi:multicomponent Na+:H+ antiporter subunit E